MATFASSLTNAGIHIDSFNPENLRNNCAFVTIAYLLNTDAQSLCDFIDIRPTPSDAGVNLDTIIDALKRVGAVYRWRNFMETKRAMPTEGSSWEGEDRYCRHLGRGMPEGRRHGVGWPSQVGVAYRRPDGTGHVVVLKLPGTPYRFYMDYQQSRRGRDVTREVKQGTAHLMFSISLDPPPSFEFHPGAHERKSYIQSYFNGGPQWTYCESQNGVEYMEEDGRNLSPDLNGEGVADNEEQLIEYMEQDRQNDEDDVQQWIEYREQYRRSLSSVEEGVGYEYDTDDVYDEGDENDHYAELNEEEYDEQDVYDEGDENDHYAELNREEYDEQDVYVKGDENVYYAEEFNRELEDEQDIYDEGEENVHYTEEFNGVGGQEDYEGDYYHDADENPYNENEIWSMSRVREALPNIPMWHCCECQPEDCCRCTIYLRDS